MKVMLALAGSSILYHIIDLRHAVAAMRNDKFVLAPVISNEVEAKHSLGNYFLSLARSKDNDYFRKNTFSGNKVVFVLDGQKMNANYKIKPVNYWSTGNSADDETEDRLFSNSRTIPCLRYIKEIHFAQDGDGKQNQSRMLAIIAKKNKIALFQYANGTDLITLNPKKRIALQVSAPAVEKFGKGTYNYGKKFTTRAEAWWDAIAFPDDDKLEPHKVFVEGAKDKDRKNFRQRVYDALRRGVSYGPEAPLAEFKSDTSERYADSDEYVEKISKYLSNRRMLQTQLMQYLIDKFSAHEKAKKQKRIDDAKVKYPKAPTFYIYKTETGYRLEVENYPELNQEAPDVDTLTDVAYKFHRDSANIYDNYNARIERMF
jgi:hypothetical protein